MDHSTSLLFIDSDTRRRAQICHSLADHAIHVEPFEKVAELVSSWPREGTILIEDADSSICELIDHMADHGDWFPIIAFGEQPSAGQIVRAVLDGAIDYIVWPFSITELSHATQKTSNQLHGLSNARMREAMARGRICKLSQREREVLDYVASGLSNRKIGEILAISPRTVEIHRANMLNKLGAEHTSQAIRIAVEAELVRAN